MDMEAVCEAISTRLETITGLRPFPYPPDDINPPTIFPNGNGAIDFDASYARGLDVINLPLTLAVDRTFDRAAWKALLPYVKGSGATSVKAVLEAGSYDFLLAVRNVDFGQIEVAGVDYLGAMFTLEIHGSGN